jgi:hypothetical protein
MPAWLRGPRRWLRRISTRASARTLYQAQEECKESGQHPVQQNAQADDRQGQHKDGEQ